MEDTRLDIVTCLTRNDLATTDSFSKLRVPLSKMRLFSLLLLVMGALHHVEASLLALGFFDFSKVVLLAVLPLDLLLFVFVQVCRMLPLDLQEPCVTLVESAKLVAESAKTYIVNTMVSLDIKVRIWLVLPVQRLIFSVLSLRVGSTLAGNTRPSSSRQPSLPKPTS